MNDIQTSHLKSAGSCAIVLRTLFDSCFNFIGKLLLTIFYYSYRIILLVKSYVSTNYLNVLNDLRTSFRKECAYDETLLKSEVLLYKKIPQHLTLLVGEESPSYKDFVNIIKWSVPAGISHVSFYDHHNGIDSEILFSYVCRYAKQYIPLIKWGKSFNEDIKLTSKTQINGFTWKPLVSVHIYTGRDWTTAVLKCVEDLRVGGESDELQIPLLDSALRKRFLAPDPDLALVAGNALSFFGFPPWHLRITQIQRIPSHHNLTVDSFLKSLREYSSCQQRYGK